MGTDIATDLNIFLGGGWSMDGPLIRKPATVSEDSCLSSGLRLSMFQHISVIPSSLPYMSCLIIVSVTTSSSPFIYIYIKNHSLAVPCHGSS